MLTPRELAREFEAARRRQRDKIERDIVLAWQITRIHVLTKNQKRVPDLKALLPKDPGTQRQTVAQQRAALSLLSEAFGGQLRARKTASSPPAKTRKRGAHGR